MSAEPAWKDEADGVFRGGGVKGIALAGALEGMAAHPEKPVTKWVNVAGASAGAIIACYLATDHDAAEMTEVLSEAPFGDFADFPLGSKALGYGRLLFRRGMARGSTFEQWLDGHLEGRSFGDIPKRLVGEEADWKLKLIAVDVSQKRLLVLPEDLADYRVPGQSQRIDPDDFNIARAARMSMSLPYFFEPVELVNGENGISTIIDGGTLSNFPVWLFDVDPTQAGRAPKRPTFGLTLSGGRGLAPKGLKRLVPWPLRFGVDIFQTASQAWDKRFESHSTRVRSFASDAGDVATADFRLSDEQKAMLHENGRAAATKFLDEFSLADYMNTYSSRIGGE